MLTQISNVVRSPIQFDATVAMIEECNVCIGIVCLKEVLFDESRLFSLIKKARPKELSFCTGYIQFF